jgi:imidazolonepropionase-like amidohydrolase
MKTLNAVRRALTCIAAALPLAACAAVRSTAPRPGGQAIAFVHAGVVDVEAGRLLPDRTVVVERGRITAVDSARPAPRGAQVVDATGRFLMPGLWDMHVHAFMAGDSALGITRRAADVFFPLFIAAGVTGIRDMGGVPDSLAAVRRRVADGSVPAPSIVAAGPHLSGPSPYGAPVQHTIVVATPEQARAAVDSLRRLGADFVKVHDLLSPAAFREVAAAARRAGLPLAGHLRPGIDPREASDLGQVSFEHVAPELSAWCGPDGAARADSYYTAWRQGQWSFASSIAAKRRLRETRDEASCAGLYERMRANGTHLVPTLVYELVDSTAAADPWLAYLPPAMRRFCALVAEYRLQAPAADRQAHERAVLNDVRAMHAAGVQVLAGTDLGAACGAPGFGLHDELARLVQAGLTPAEALRTATLAPARFLHAADTLGTVSVGRRADLVLLTADPLADIRNVRAVSGVMLHGRWLPRPALDGMLAEVRARVEP